jgi:DNA-directed RNA polymerase specialized sigma24 family protein
VEACLGPREIDIAHFRANLFVLADRALADAWVEACLRAGVVADYDPWWDAVVAADFLPDEHARPVRRALDELVLAAVSPSR